MIITTTGKDIRAARLARGWSQIYFAGLFGSNRSVLSEIEQGRRDVPEGMAVWVKANPKPAEPAAVNDNPPKPKTPLDHAKEEREGWDAREAKTHHAGNCPYGDDERAKRAAWLNGFYDTTRRAA